MLSQVTKKDIERLIYENIPIEKNPNWPNLESSGWKWKKYADGTVEAWYRKQHAVAITAAYEDHFRGDATVNFPFDISGYPVVRIQIRGLSSNFIQVHLLQGRPQYAPTLQVVGSNVRGWF